MGGCFFLHFLFIALNSSFTFESPSLFPSDISDHYVQVLCQLLSWSLALRLLPPTPLPPTICSSLPAGLLPPWLTVFYSKMALCQNFSCKGVFIILGLESI